MNGPAQAPLHASFELLAQPQRPDPQCVDGNPQAVGQAPPIVDLDAVRRLDSSRGSDPRPSRGGRRGKGPGSRGAAPSTGGRTTVPAGGGGPAPAAPPASGPRARWSSCTRFPVLLEDVARHAVEVAHGILDVNDSTFEQAAGDASDGVVCVVFGRGAAPALEERDEGTTNVLVPGSGALAVAIEHGQERVERLLIQAPVLLARGDTHLHSPCSTKGAQ